MFKSNDTPLHVLLQQVGDGVLQLPDFQRDWVWDDERIRKLLASVSREYPLGAIMTLEANGDVRFEPRPIQGTDSLGPKKPDLFLLDGQQRLTSLYQALKRNAPVDTPDRNNRRVRTKRWYYIDMLEIMKGDRDTEEAFISVPEDKKITEDFGRTIKRDLSTVEGEYEHHMMPTRNVMDPVSWLWGTTSYTQYWSNLGGHPHGDVYDFAARFNESILSAFKLYQIPVIQLGKETSKEAVCTVFENVNTGGVTLNVFELVTAAFAADDFQLRKDWEIRSNRLHSQFGALQGIGGEQFLQAVTLLATQAKGSVSAKKRDVLELTLDEYQAWAAKVEEGFKKVGGFLRRQFVFRRDDVPYNTQLVPLAALFASLGSEIETANAQERIEHWYWSGIFNESYGSTVETQYARDLIQVANYIRNGTLPQLMVEADFKPERLLFLRRRNSAAYKGLYALQMKNGAADWRTSNPLTIATFDSEKIDIHHIFPVAWCRNNKENPTPIPQRLYDSIINKTPIDALTNQMIGGKAPSAYLSRLKEQNNDLEQVLLSHWIEIDHLESNNFAGSFVKRGLAMLDLIGQAMDKKLSDGEGVFESALRSAGLMGDTVTAQDEVDDEDNDYDDIGSAAYDDGDDEAA